MRKFGRPWRSASSARRSNTVGVAALYLQASAPELPPRLNIIWQAVAPAATGDFVLTKGEVLHRCRGTGDMSSRSAFYPVTTVFCGLAAAT
jgi:hypothetical protein